MFTYTELQSEVKRSALRDKSGTEFDTTVKNTINRAIYRVAREANWRSLRRESSFNTVSTYTTGSGNVAVTNGSTTVTVTGATFLTDGITIGRRIKLGGSSKKYRISQVTGETTLVVDQAYDSTTSTSQTYSIYPQGQYNLPIQSSHRVFLWHEQYGHPFQMEYITAQEGFSRGFYEDTTSIPTRYRMWGEDMVIEQLRSPSALTVVSSDTSDTSISVTVFGIVAGYPDYETITTNASNGTTSVTGSKTFQSVERVSVENTTRTGRITVTANSGNTTVAVIPAGNTTKGIFYRKIEIRPLPSGAYPIFVYYYKTPYFLVNDNDIHELGPDFDNAIIYLSTALIDLGISKKESDRWFGLYKDEIRSLKKTNMDKIDWLPRLRQRDEGAYYGGRLHRTVEYGQIGTGGYYGPPVR